MSFWNRNKQPQVTPRPGIQPDTPPKKAGWVQRREEKKEEERLRAESVKTGIALGPIEPSGELTHQQKMEKEALGQIGQMRQEAKGKTHPVEEAAMHQLIREARAVQAESKEGTAPQAPEKQQTAAPEAPEAARPTLSERRAVAIDPTRLRESITKFEKDVRPTSKQAPEGKVAIPVGAGDSESRG